MATAFAVSVQTVCSLSKKPSSCNDQKCAPRCPCCTRRKALRSLALSAVLLPQTLARADDGENSWFDQNKDFVSNHGILNLQSWFASAMERDMKEYEERIEPRKRRLFKDRVRSTDTVLDIGIGTGPNLKFLPSDCRVIGLEPNKFMWPYSRARAEQLGISLELQDARAESIPIPDRSCNVVISTLTLCSVSSPTAVLNEIGRVLKPGGFFIFVEHTIAPESQFILRAAQNFLNPLQNIVSEGCNLNRDTERTIRIEGFEIFDRIQIERFRAEFSDPLDKLSLVAGVSLVAPHISGWARRSQGSG